MIQAIQPTPEALLQRVVHLQQKLNDQIEVSNGWAAHSHDLDIRIEILNRQNIAAVQRTVEYIENLESLLRTRTPTLELLKEFTYGMTIGVIVEVINLISWIASKIIHAVGVLVRFVTCNRFNN